MQPQWCSDVAASMMLWRLGFDYSVVRVSASLKAVLIFVLAVNLRSFNVYVVAQMKENGGLLPHFTSSKRQWRESPLIASISSDTLTK